jgi:protein-disulfide isomerase
MHTLLSKSARLAGLGLIMGLAIAASGCSKSGSSAATAISAGDQSEGVANAPVTVIEYASVACPICAAVNHDVMPQFKAKYVDTGKVHYVYKPMLTGDPAVATAGHLLAQCAGKDKYFKVIDAVMRSQEQMGGEQTRYANARPVLLDIAQSAGLSEDQFNSCVQDAKGIQEMSDKNDAAMKAGVNETPTFFVNGKKLQGTPQSIADFDKVIQPLLK